MTWPAVGTAAAGAGARSGRRRVADVAIVDWGAGNLRSVVSAFGRAGSTPVITTDPAVAREARLAVVAGVGHVQAASSGLGRTGLADALRDRASSARPTLGICVGLQLLFEESEEGGCGLSLLGGSVVRLRAPRVPHMGWNELRITRPIPLLAGLDRADVYFAHSYAAEPEDATVVAAVTEHGGPVVAAVAADALGGVQFHPERSGAAGARLLANALAWSRSA
jgi:imidazole glycerol-phosphate synthase subunit HisH